MLGQCAVAHLVVNDAIHVWSEPDGGRAKNVAIPIAVRAGGDALFLADWRDEEAAVVLLVLIWGVEVAERVDVVEVGDVEVGDAEVFYFEVGGGPGIFILPFF